MITNLLTNVSNRKLQKASFLLIEFLVVSPLIIMLLNLLPITVVQVYNFWYTITYFVGDLGLLIGGILIVRLAKDEVSGFWQGIKALFPLLLLVAFGLWCFVCDGNSRFKFISFLSYSTCQDGFFMFVAYFGILLMGFALSVNKSYILKVAKTFAFVSLIVAIVSLMNNGITETLCRNQATNTGGYEAIFYNTNHYGYYLVFGIMVTGFLFIYSEKYIMKLLYAISVMTLTVLLVLNNTMGSHLAILLALLIMLVWSFATRDDNKIGVAQLLLIFVFASLLTLCFTDNVFVNYSGLFTNIKTILFGQEYTGETIESVGTGRGLLWSLSLEIAKQNPIFGIGAVNAFLSAHNMFLQIAMQFGFVGLVIYLSMLFAGVTRLIKKKQTIGNTQKLAAFCVVAYLISAFFGVTMFYTAPYYYLVLGMCFSSAFREIDESSIKWCFEKE